MPTKLQILETDIRQLYAKRLRKARESFIKSLTYRATKNCKHCLQSQGSVFCKIAAIGVDHQSSISCDDVKAAQCSSFEIKITPVRAGELFEAMSPEERALRFPQLKALSEVLELFQKVKDEP